MGQFLEAIEQFAEDHPVWFWVLVRFVVILAAILTAVFGVVALFLVLLVIAAVVELKLGIAVFCLLLLALACLAAWVCGSLVGKIMQEID